jgi:hypothetical protein
MSRCPPRSYGFTQRFYLLFGFVMSKSTPGSVCPPSYGMQIVWAALALYVISFVIPLGVSSFGLALDRLIACIRDPQESTIGDWLLSLAWVANPSVWLAFFFLFTGSRGRAAVAGEFALLMAVCAVASAGLLPSYYCWLTSMVLVVYATLRVTKPVRRLSEPLNAQSAGIMTAKPRRIFYLAVGLPAAFAIVLGLLAHWRFYRPVPELPEFDPNENVMTAQDAKAKILRWAGTGMVATNRGANLPASANDFWLYDAGSFGGTTTYCTFRCSDRADCLKAVDYLGGVREKNLKPWEPSRYAVVMEGPGFYSRTLSPSEKLRSNRWDVRGIQNGLVSEDVRGDHDGLVYCAIDLDRNRVYYIIESGGFPPDEYPPIGDHARDAAMPK